MAYFLKNGNTFKVSSKEAMDLYESLPAATYVVKFNPMTGFYLEIIEILIFQIRFMVQLSRMQLES